MDTRFWTDRLKGVFDGYELCFTKERLRKYEAADGELLSLELKEEEGISLRAIKDGKMVFSYTYEKGEEAASALINNGRLIMPFLEGDPNNLFPSSSGGYEGLDFYDEGGLKVPDERKIAAIIEVESTIRGFDPRITRTRNCELHESEIEVAILNSQGLEGVGRKTIYTLSGMAVAANKDEEVSWYDWAWDTRYEGLDHKALAERIGAKALSFLGGMVLDTGVYTGLLPPACACQLLEILSPSFLGENLHKNKTRLKDRVGKKCFSGLLSIIDSGTRGIDAFPFDGEGVPSQDNTVVKDGVLEGFLYDSYYGKVFNKPSTGNAVRPGIKSPPRCDTRGFFIQKGSDDGLDGFSNGIVIEELMGTHTANEVTGDFSVGAVGHYRRGGSSAPFKGVILSGNLFDVLSQVAAVGTDLTFHGSVGSPSLVIEGLKISGK